MAAKGNTADQNSQNGEDTRPLSTAAQALAAEDQQRLLDADAGTVRRVEAENGEGPPPPIQYRTRHDVTVAVKALEFRKQSLDNLAKKNAAEGYPREARVMSADSAAIVHYILPAMRGQGELPLVSPQTLIERISNRLVDVITRARKRKQSDDQVATALAYRVRVMVEAAESAGFAAGYAARENEAEHIIARAIEEVPSDVWEEADKASEPTPVTTI